MMDDIKLTYVEGLTYIIEGTYNGRIYRDTMELDSTIPIEDAIQIAMEDFEEDVTNGSY